MNTTNPLNDVNLYTQSNTNKINGVIKEMTKTTNQTIQIDTVRIKMTIYWMDTNGFADVTNDEYSFRYVLDAIEDGLDIPTACSRADVLRQEHIEAEINQVNKEEMETRDEEYESQVRRSKRIRSDRRAEAIHGAIEIGIN